MHSSIHPYNKIIENAVALAIKETKKQVLEQKKKQFDNKGSNDWYSESWPKLQESTKKRKRYRYPDFEEHPIYRTGALKDSLHEAQGEMSLSVETDVDYSKYQENWLNKKGSTHSYVEMSDKEVEGAVDFFVESLVREIKNGFA